MEDGNSRGRGGWIACEDTHFNRGGAPAAELRATPAFPENLRIHYFHIFAFHLLLPLAILTIDSPPNSLSPLSSSETLSPEIPGRRVTLSSVRGNQGGGEGGGADHLLGRSLGKGHRLGYPC